MTGEVSDVTRFVTVGENEVEEEIAPALEGIHEVPGHFFKMRNIIIQDKQRLKTVSHTHTMM